MSKIKDLYAIVNEIDDLIPERKVDAMAVASAAIKHITACSQDVYELLYEEAELSRSYNDEGKLETYFENYLELCEKIADCGVSNAVEDLEADLTDEDYKRAVEKVRDIVADTYTDYESEIIEQLKKDAKEQQEQRESYDNLTLPKERS